MVPKLVTRSARIAPVVDVNSDMQQNGLQTYVNIDRATAARYGFAPNQIDNVLYDAFGQRTVSTIYNPYNQYFVVMEVAPKYWQYPRCSIASISAPPRAMRAARSKPRCRAAPLAASSPSACGAARHASAANALNANAQANLSPMHLQ